MRNFLSYHLTIAALLFVVLAWLLPTSVYGPGFVDAQLRNGRVYTAKTQKDAKLRALFEKKGLHYPPSDLFYRVFKSEKMMEVWVRDDKDEAYQLLKTYPVCAMSGDIGPKQKQGDLQVPEGLYHTTYFNPNSTYYLSMKINYPNASDRKRAKYSNLGGDIFIHGHCGSKGCVAINDSQIKEVYWLSTLAKGNGQKRIPVHIFPARMSDMKHGILDYVFRSRPHMRNLWRDLKRAYDLFEATKVPPAFTINEKGRYIFTADVEREQAEKETVSSMQPLAPISQ